jgi:hypothetical protein
MTTLRYEGEFATEKLRVELLEAGVPEMIVQKEEDAAQAVAIPVLDENSEPVLSEDGNLTYVLRWRNTASGEFVEVPTGLIPDDAQNGSVIQLGPGAVTIVVPDGADEDLVAEIVAEHDPTPPLPPPSAAEQLAELLEDANVTQDVKNSALATFLRGR